MTARPRESLFEYADRILRKRGYVVRPGTERLVISLPRPTVPQQPMYTLRRPALPCR